MPVALALAASLIWGAADFVGGTISRSLAAATVMLWSTLLVFPVLVVVVVVSGDLVLDGTTVGWGAFAGVAGALGISSLYQGLATGVMGVVAPISSTSVLVPVLVGVATGDDLAALQVAGVVVAIVGVVLTGGPHLREFRSGGHVPVLWALAAALGIGGSLVGLAYGAETSSVSALLVQRVVYVAVLVGVVLAVRAERRPERQQVPTLGVLGLGDLSANGLFAVAARSGPLAVVSVVASLYPVATVLLARQLQGERLARVQIAGVVAALIGVSVVVAA
ncbi:MAG TPA: EamA family transporter [Acidimicrobiales bacterium]